MKQRNIEIAREDRILEKDLSCIADPTVHAHYQAQQLEIIQKRTQPSSTSNDYCQYFPNFGGDGTDLPPY